MKLLRPAGAKSEIWQIFIADSSSTTGAGLTGLVNNSSGLTAYYHRDTDTTATSISLASMTVGTFTSSGFKEIDATNMPGWYQFCPPNAALDGGAKSCAFHLKGATNMAPLAIECQLGGEMFGIVDAGTLQSATGTTAVIRSGASFGDSRLNGMSIVIYAGTGAGQSRVITAYNNTSKTVTVDTWTTNPDSTSAYAIFATAGASASVPPAANTTFWNGTAVATPATAGVPDVNVKNMNNVAATSITTINANQGTTQPVNFTGSGASALAKSDAVDIGSQAVTLDANNNLSVNVVDWKGSAAPANTGDAFARLGAPVGASISADVAGVPAALLDVAAGVETGLTVRQAFRLWSAVLLGKASGLNTNAPVYRDTGDTKNRVSATTDANGNRTAVTLNST